MSSPEAAAKAAICQYLDLQGNHLLYWVQQSQGIWSKARGVYLKKPGYFKNGMPDIGVQLTIRGLPIFVGLEVKAGRNKQDPDQVEFQKLMEQGRGFYFVVHNIHETKLALEAVEREVLSRLGHAPIF